MVADVKTWYPTDRPVGKPKKNHGSKLNSVFHTLRNTPAKYTIGRSTDG